MRPKKKTRSKNGHRQELTRVMVESISIKGKTSTKAEPKKQPKEDTVAKEAPPASKVKKTTAKVSKKPTTGS